MMVILSLPYVRNDAIIMHYRVTKMVWQETDVIKAKPVSNHNLAKPIIMLKKLKYIKTDIVVEREETNFDV
jgi:hypothetical protein